MKFLSKILRPLFGIFLFISQFMSKRDSFFSESIILIIIGVFILLLGILLLISASRHLSKAKEQNRLAITGPYRFIRHPIYLTVFIIAIGLGLVFFSVYWFVVIILFIPLWVLECRREEKEMILLFNEDYREYMKKTKMLIPKII